MRSWRKRSPMVVGSAVRGEPGCISRRRNLTRRCGGAEDVREVLKTMRSLRLQNCKERTKRPTGAITIRLARQRGLGAAPRRRTSSATRKRFWLRYRLLTGLWIRRQQAAAFPDQRRVHFAAGYDPSISSRTERFPSASMARRIFRSLKCPSISAKNRYSLSVP